MVYCQNCGSENVDDAKFCVNCGAEIKRVKKEERKQEVKESPPERPKIPRQPPSKSFLPSSKTFMVALTVVIAIICLSVVILVTNPFGSNEKNNNTPSNTVTFSVQEFYDALNYSIDSKNYTIFSNIEGVKNGDILKITGKIDQLVNNYDKNIGEYTSLALYCSNKSNLIIHVLGNVSNRYSVGDYVVVTLHLINCYGNYKDLYGATWILLGEFMKEEFINEKFAFDIIIPQNQIRKI